MGLIRFLLALIVVISHTEPLFGFNFIGGKLAVQSFYMISGFYMALVLTEKYIGKNKSYRLFITNRLIRLYPIYWSVILIIIISSLVYGFISNGTNYGLLNPYIVNYNTLHISSLIFISFSNIFIFFQDTLLFFEIDKITGLLEFQSKLKLTNLNGSSFALIGPAWTIGLEVLFYLIAPFLVKQKNYILLILIAISLTIKYFIRHKLGFNHAPWNFRFFPNELYFFLFGILAYRLYKIKTYLSLKKIYYTALTPLILSILFYDKINFDIKYYIFFTSLFLVLPFLFNQTKNLKKDRFIGELSYPIYICHMFIVITVSSTNLYIYNKGITVIILSIITAIGLKYFISDKVEKYRQKRIKTN